MTIRSFAPLDPSIPFAVHIETVRPEWIDYNGHMNVAYYVLAFDHATDALFDRLGIGAEYARNRDGSLFVVEAHVTYDREVSVGEALRFETQILGCDDKRLHLFHRMIRAADGSLAATTELLALHMNMKTRRAGPFPEDVRGRIAAAAAAHADLPRPPQAGRIIALKPP
ncbi:MAG: thioesterase-like protein [Alphaproteobacteria bacterium]|nr:thioesterase-like protein [Alphaproteobacteria bacterium]